MSSIDERVVQMQFDNGQFEQGVGTTLNSLDKLNSALEFSGVADSLSAISERFSTLGIVGMRIVEDLTDKFVALAENIAKTLLIAPVTTGFSEYEQKMDNIQTTVINSGQSLEKVNEILDDLNFYADKTIFKFSDMTSALSKFTMAGVDLDVAKTSIEGIGNAAGEAGLKTSQASSAFYMISQAISSGKMSLYQWRTLENTGFASQKFKTALLETAAAMNTLKKNSDGTYTVLNDKGKEVVKNGKKVVVSVNDIRNSLTEYGWATSDVLTTTFSRYASDADSIRLGLDKISEEAFHAAQDIKTFSQLWDTLGEAAQSGWAMNWQMIVGDYEEAKVFFNWLNKQLTGSIESGDEFDGVLTQISNSQYEVIKQWRDMGGREAAINGIKNSFEIIAKYIKPIGNAINEFMPKITGEKLATVSKKFEAFTASVLGTTDAAENFSKFTNEMEVTKIGKLSTHLSTLVDEYGNLSRKGKQLDMSWVWADEAATSVETLGETVKKTGKLFDDSGMFDDVKFINGYEFDTQKAETFGKIIDGISSAIHTLGETVRALIDPFKQLGYPIEHVKNSFISVIEHFAEGAIQMDETGSAVERFKRIISPLYKIIKWIGDGIILISDAIAGFLTSGSIEKLTSGISSIFDKLHPIQSIFNFFSKGLDFIINGIKELAKTIKEKLAPVLGDKGIGESNLIGIFATLFALNKASGVKDIANSFKPLEKIKDIIGSVGDVLDQLKEKLGGGGGLDSGEILKLGVALGLMAVSLALIASIDIGNLAKSLGAVATTLGELLLAVNMMGKTNLMNPNGIKTMSTVLIKLGVAVLIFALAMKMMGGMDIGAAAQGFVAISALLWEMVGVMKVTRKFEERSVAGMIALATATVIFCASIAILGKMDFMTLVQGFVGLSAMLWELVGVLKVLEKIDTDKLLGTAAGLVLFADAIVVMSVAVLALGAVSWGSMIQGLAGIAVLLGEVAGFTVLMDKFADPGKMAAFGASMILFAVAIDAMAVGLVALGVIKTSKLLGIVGALALIFTEIGATLVILDKASSPVKLAEISAALLIFSAAIAVLAPALILMGTVPFATIMTSLAGVAAAIAVLGVATAILAPMATSMLIVAAALGVFGAAIYVLGAGLLEVSVALATFNSAIKVFESWFGLMFETIFTAIGVFIDKMFELVDKIVDLIIACLEAIAAAIREKGPDILASLIDIIASLIKVIWEAIKEYGPKLWEKIKELVSNAIQAIKDKWPEWKEAAAESIARFIAGIVYKWVLFKKELKDKLNDMMQTVRDKISEWKQAGKDAIDGFINGVKDKIKDAVDAVKGLGSRVLNGLKDKLGIASPSKEFAIVGKYSDEGLANGLEQYSKIAEKASGSIGLKVLDATKEPLKNLGKDLGGDFKIKPVVTPVMDLNNIQNGSDSFAKIAAAIGSINPTIGATLDKSLQIENIGKEITKLKDSIQGLVDKQLTDTQIANAMRDSMKNVGIYMDSNKVGKVVTAQQSAFNRASGV